MFHICPLSSNTFQYKQFVDVKILGLDTKSFLEHNIIYGQELISNHYVYLISEKDSNFIFDVNNDNIEKIYPFKTYRFEFVKAPPDIAM